MNHHTLSRTCIPRASPGLSAGVRLAFLSSDLAGECHETGASSVPLSLLKNKVEHLTPNG